MKEKWRLIPGFENYAVSTLGRVRHEKFNRILKGTPRKGYRKVELVCPNCDAPKEKFIHRLVLLAFQGSPPLYHETRHLNGKRSDNRLRNLQWGTHTENMGDRELHGRGIRGERNPNSKLVYWQVEEIRDLIAGGRMTNVQIAKRYGVSKSLISQIKKGNLWA